MDESVTESARSRLLGGVLFMLLVAAVMWTLMWTVFFFVYWYYPTLLLLSALEPVLPDPFVAPPLLIQGVYAVVLYVLVPVLVLLLTRRWWWWRWTLSGLLLFNVTYLPFLAVQVLQVSG